MAKKTYLTHDALLGAVDATIEEVYVPSLDGHVRVRGMSGIERDAFEQSCIQGRGRRRDVNLRGMRAKLVAYCCVDDSGVRLFSEAEVDKLGQVRAEVLDRLFSVAQRLSGMRDEDIEELGQPSGSRTASDISSSPLPLNSG